MATILMRPLTSGVFQRLMQRTLSEIGAKRLGRLLTYVLFDPYRECSDRGEYQGYRLAFS